MSAPYKLSKYEWSNYNAIKYMHDYAKQLNWKCDPQFIFADKYGNMRSYKTLKCRHIKLTKLGEFIFELHQYLPLIIFIGPEEYTRKTICGQVTISFNVNYLCMDAFMYISKTFGKSNIANNWYNEGARFTFADCDDDSIYDVYNGNAPILSWIVRDKNKRERELLYASIYIEQSKYFWTPAGTVSNIK